MAYTDRFTAAVAKAPIIKIMSFCGNVDGNPICWCEGGRFEDFFWDDPSGHLERSPIPNVGRINTPTLVMTGSRGLRTPMSQTQEPYRALNSGSEPPRDHRRLGELSGCHGLSRQAMVVRLLLLPA